ncbi:MAG: YidH family protein, partial [Nitrospirota bacterium]
MSEMIEDKKSSKVRNRRVHMANERTFLAWIRTSIGIMAFGFVVEKFALFVKQISYLALRVIEWVILYLLEHTCKYFQAQILLVSETVSPSLYNTNFVV